MPTLWNYVCFGYFLILAGLWIFRVRKAINILKDPPNVLTPPRHCSPPPSSSENFISVIIPAKNEELNIAPCLDSLSAQDYPHYEILVANDGSKDRTGEILKTYEGKIKIVHVSPTPKGWTGKNFAIHSAMSQARGHWFLFTDADTRHEKNSLSLAMAYAESRKLSFLTLLPRCLTGGFFENVLQPCMMGFMGLWFPLHEINAPSSKLYFANGQYILMRAELHHRIGGHKNVYDQYLEDFALMKRTRELGENAECAFGTAIFGTRMYHAFSSIWRGWRRIFLHAYQKNASQLLQKMADVFLSAALPFYLLPFFMLQPDSSIKIHMMLLGFLLILLGVIGFLGWKTYDIIQAKKGYLIFFPFSAVVLALILGHAAWIAATGQKTKWR